MVIWKYWIYLKNYLIIKPIFLLCNLTKNQKFKTKIEYFVYNIETNLGT